MPRRSPAFRRQLGWLLVIPFVVSLLSMSTLGTGAQGGPLCTATLDGSQEVPSVPTAGTGSGTIDFVGFAPNGNTIVSINLSFQNLSSSQIDSHIHGPAMAGVSAGVIIQLNRTAPTTNQMVELTALQRDILTANLGYFNVHTVAYPSGEIRGQISCNAFPEPPATATPTPTQTSTATPTPTLGPGQPSCDPRPRVELAVTRGDGALQVRVRVNGAQNTLRSIQFGAARNGLIDLPPDIVGSPGSTTFTAPAGSTEVTFTLRRVTAGQATQAPFVVTDDCGTWPTFVGGGPSAF